MNFTSVEKNGANVLIPGSLHLPSHPSLCSPQIPPPGPSTALFHDHQSFDPSLGSSPALPMGSTKLNEQPPFSWHLLYTIHNTPVRQELSPHLTVRYEVPSAGAWQLPVARPQTRSLALPHKVCHPPFPPKQPMYPVKASPLPCFLSPTPSLLSITGLCGHEPALQGPCNCSPRLHPSTFSLAVAREDPNLWARPGLPGIQASDKGLTSF